MRNSGWTYRSQLFPCEGVSLQALVSPGAQPRLSEGILAPACRA